VIEARGRAAHKVRVAHPARLPKAAPGSATAKQIKDRPLAPLARKVSRGCDVLESRMISRCEEKGEVVFAMNARPPQEQINPHAKSFENIGAAGLEVTARLPCLATVTPAAAQINAAAVEILNVPSVATSADDVEDFAARFRHREVV